MMCSSTGRPPIGPSGFGMTVVYGRRRVPCPPARITALMPTPFLRRAPLHGPACACVSPLLAPPSLSLIGSLLAPPSLSLIGWFSLATRPCHAHYPLTLI